MWVVDGSSGFSTVQRDLSLSYVVSGTSTGGTPSPFTLTSSTSGTLPFTVGYAFRQGDIPSGSGIAIAGATAQATIKNTWPDGSAKFAIIAGSYTSAGSAVTVTPSAGTASTGTALTTADLIATGITASIDAGAFGAASFGNTEWAAPFQSWVSGHRMSSWIYRKPIGSDAHLVAWLEVRLYAGGAVEVLPWIENGYINVASPTNKSATYSFTLGGTVRNGGGQAIDLKHHQRTPLVAGTALSYWLGSDPGVVPLHDAAYLMATEMVPSYFGPLTAGHARVVAQPTTYTPLQIGSFVFDSDNMALGGYQRPIGPLPEHDVLHLIADPSDRPTTYRSVIRNGYSAGRYGIHYRDEATNLPLRFSDHPARVIAAGQGFSSSGGGSTFTPTATGGGPPTWDVAHSPSVGYMAYLLTGRRYFLDEVQFATTCNFLGVDAGAIVRNGSQGLLQPCLGAFQTRASAWGWRTHVQALAITPSDDWLYTEFINRAHFNIDDFWTRYVNTSNNAFGFIDNGTNAYASNLTNSKLAPWQQDFVTSAWGMAKSLGLPIDSTRRTRLDEFFNWTAKSVVGRLGTSGTFPFENANRFIANLNVAEVNLNWRTGAGPWPADWAAIYSYTTPLAVTPDNPLATPGSNTLATEFDATSAAKGIWGNLQWGISYAVRHGVTGASAAYARMTGATNWTSMLRNNFTASHPVMGMKPLVDAWTTPAWMSSALLNRYTNIPNTAGAGGTAVNAYSGMVLGQDLKLRIALAGGHGDSSDNRVAQIDLSVDAPTGWTTLSAASINRPAPDGTLPANAAYYSDDAGGTANLKPGSRHTYSNMTVLDEVGGRIFAIGYFATYPNASIWNLIDAFSLGTNTWGAPDSWPRTGTATGRTEFSGIVSGFVYHDKNANLVYWKSDNYVWRLNLATGVRTQLAASFDTVSGLGYGGWEALGRYPIGFSRSRNEFFSLQWGNGQGVGSGLTAGRILNPSATSPTFSVITLGASAALTALEACRPWYASMDYDELRARYVFTAGGNGDTSGSITSTDWTKVFEIVPNGTTTWDVVQATFASTAVLPGSVPANGTHGRFQYIQRGGIGGFVVLANASDTLKFYRTT